MDNRTNRIFSMGVITIMTLSILVLAAPVMAKECAMSTGVQCEPTYTKYETFVSCGSIYNNEPGSITYSMTLTVYDLSGEEIDRDSFSGDGHIESVKHYLRTAPPAGGWDPGTYKFRNTVVASGARCTYSKSKHRTFIVHPDKPDLVITDVWNDDNTIYYKIKNVGTKGAEASSTSLTADGVFVTSDSVASLEPETVRKESFNYVMDCTHKIDTIKVCADYMGDVAEIDETNNCQIKTSVPSIRVSPALFDVRSYSDVVSNYTLIIENTWLGTLEFNVSDAVDSHVTSQSGWPKTTGKTGFIGKSSPVLGDIDGDGDIEVVVGSYDNKVYAWHHDGSNVAGWPKTTGGDVDSSPALGDIDGDGDMEIVVGSDDGKVYAWHHNGLIVKRWPRRINFVVISSPALGDIDGDGDIEVVVGSKKVYAWDCSGNYNPNNIEWGTFHHDVMRTGLYETMQSEKVDWLSEYPINGTVNPGGKTDTIVTFNTNGLHFNEYSANIIITSNDPDEPTMIIPVRLTVAPLQKGDLNGDDNITSADAATALEIAAGSRSCDAAALVAADVSGDGSVTSLDALMILQAAAGRISL